jgi:hypothetical protein
MECCIVKPILRLTCCCLGFGMLTVMFGCTKTPHSTTHVEVTGNVLFQGQPLPGGQVTFVAVKGGFSSAGTIDENGHYQIKAPVGEVRIGVDNKMLQPQQSTRGGRAPKDLHHPKPPGAAGEAHAIKGRWVRIPNQYADPVKSGLTYTVKPETQTHDIELTANPTPPPDTPGS